MHALYDATILLSISLATVVGAVFAVAATFLGRALGHAREAEARAAERRQADFDDLVQNIQTSASAAEASKRVSKAEWGRRRRGLESWWAFVRHGPRLLTVLHSVMIPGSLFLVAGMLSAWAKLHTPAGQAGWDPSGWWLTALGILSLGLWRLVSVLRAVEIVGSASEQSYFREQTAAFRTALDQRDQDLRPQLELEVKRDRQLTAGVEASLRLRLTCGSGGAAHDIAVFLWLPENFQFVDEATARTDPSGGAVARVMHVDSLARSLWQEHTVRIRTPEEIGEYDFDYRISCDEVTLDSRRLRVDVVEAQSAPNGAASADDAPS